MGTEPGVVVTRRRTLFEDRDPQSRDHNAAFPSMVRSPDGSILLAHRVGRRKNSADGTQMLWRFDGSRWERLALDFGAAMQPRREFRTAALGRVGSGKLSMLLTWIDHPDDGSPISNAATEGLLPIHIGFRTSADSGRTWSPVSEIPAAPLEQPCGNGAIRQGRDGRWIAAFEVYKHYDDPSPWSSRAAVISSLDEGRTWQQPAIIAHDPTHQVCYWDLHLIALGDGRLLGTGWSDDRRKPGQSSTYWIESTNGVDWPQPCSIGIAAQFIEPLELPDGRIVLCYVRRAERPAICLRVADPDPRSWATAQEYLVYEQSRDDLAGATQASFGDYLQGMSQWSFGWPAIVVLDDDTILVSYYSGIGDFSAVRLAEVRLRS